MMDNQNVIDAEWKGRMTEKTDNIEHELKALRKDVKDLIKRFDDSDIKYVTRQELNAFKWFIGIFISIATFAEMFWYHIKN